jgi:hypothetical protein
METRLALHYCLRILAVTYLAYEAPDFDGLLHRISNIRLTRFTHLRRISPGIGSRSDHAAQGCNGKDSGQRV